MNLSNVIAKMIDEMLDESDEIEIQRNILAKTVGCVPSQINYVLSSRFTPERGYIVESRRGGGGCIRISRVVCTGRELLMHVVNCIGERIDEKSCTGLIRNLLYDGLIDKRNAALMSAAVSDSSLRLVEPGHRDLLRAALFKQMLLTLMQQ